MLNALQINKKIYLIDLSIENQQNIEDSGIVLAVSLTKVFSSAPTAQAYQTVITTVCIQTDN